MQENNGPIVNQLKKSETNQLADPVGLSEDVKLFLIDGASLQDKNNKSECLLRTYFHAVITVVWDVMEDTTLWYGTTSKIPE